MERYPNRNWGVLYYHAYVLELRTLIALAQALNGQRRVAALEKNGCRSVGDLIRALVNVEVLVTSNIGV